MRAITADKAGPSERSQRRTVPRPIPQTRRPKGPTVSRKLPITGRWSQTRAGMITLDFPAVPFTAIYDNGGGHVTLTLSRQQSEQCRAILFDLLAISEDSDR
jgi:hypothetical protein